MPAPTGKAFNSPAPHRAYKRTGTKGAPVTDSGPTSKVATEKVGGVLHRTEPHDVVEVRKNVSVSYVALKPMKVNGVKVKPGDLVPAANTWRNLHNYLSTGHLAVVGQ